MGQFTIDPKFIITREEALKRVPLLVEYTEGDSRGDRHWEVWETLNKFQQNAKKGQEIIVADRDYEDASKTRYIQAVVSSVTRDGLRNPDGPVIRVKAGDLSWRVDGVNQFHPVAK